MTWDASAPAVVSAIRTAIASCASWVTACADVGKEADHIHYPYANPSGLISGTPDKLPLILLDQGDVEWQRYAEGAGGIPRGIVEAVVYLPVSTADAPVGVSTYSAAAAESFADTLISELMKTQTVAWRGAITHGRASDPTAGERAADADAVTPQAFRTIHLSIPFGLNAS